MKMQTAFLISLLVMAVDLLCLAYHWVISPLPDTAVRILGVILLLDVVVLSFSTAKMVLAGRGT